MKIHERIYGILLKAYSNTFQREYGESMTQLFRDQLRDAVARARVVGVLETNNLGFVPDGAGVVHSSLARYSSRGLCRFVDICHGSDQLRPDIVERASILVDCIAG